MVFDVARALDISRRVRAALELMKNSAVWLAHDLRQNVQSASMGHAEHDVLNAKCTATLDDLLKCRDHGFAAVQTKTLGTGIFDVNEFFEPFGLDQLVENGAFALTGESDLFIRTFNTRLNPALFSRGRDVKKFPANRRAIGALKNGQHFANGRVFESQNEIDEDFAVPVGLGEAI